MMTAKYTYFALTAAVIVVLDQASKAIVLQHFQLYDSISVIPGFFNLTYIRNPGGAFGVLAGGSTVLRNLLFFGAGTVALGMILYFLHATPDRDRLMRFTLALIFGGAIGNMIDRLRFGEVVDFLDFNLVFMRWPAFNVADSAITVGILLFVYHIIFKPMPNS
ncbi:MAG: signal peptidase II [Desulfosarcinaceae bacterium]|nr:signal peptidase II [Desulfosarcinaceae bacterium]